MASPAFAASVLEILATYQDGEELSADYPDLQQEDLRQALAFASAQQGEGYF